MLRYLSFLFLSLFVSINASAAGGHPFIEGNSIVWHNDSIEDALLVKEDKGDELGTVRKVVRGFSKIDNNYIEPQHYEFTVMAQMTRTFDSYSLKGNSGHSVTFSPDITTKIGPYLGWRWFFLGYMFDLKNIGFGGSEGKTEVDFSIYSSKIGVDLYYRRTGNDYKISDIDLGNGVDVEALKGIGFNGVKVGITGFNLYYIFNSRKFSYPAAFAQSTCQKRSQGSWMAGLGYMRNSVEFDYKKFDDMAQQYAVPSISVDSSLAFTELKHYDFHLSGGYAYNWVFAKNCLFSASFSLAMAYKHAVGDVEENKWKGFDIADIDFDGIWRFGLVYNNTRWYAGASAILRTYNYSTERFKTRNSFGSLNVYIGYNFGLKERYRKKAD